MVVPGGCIDRGRYRFLVSLERLHLPSRAGSGCMTKAGNSWDDNILTVVVWGGGEEYRSGTHPGCLACSIAASTTNFPIFSRLGRFYLFVLHTFPSVACSFPATTDPEFPACMGVRSKRIHLSRRQPCPMMLSDINLSSNHFLERPHASSVDATSSQYMFSNRRQ